MIDFAKQSNFERLLDLYEQHLTSQGKTCVLIIDYLNPGRQFIQFLKEKGINEPKQVEKGHLLSFQTFLYEKRELRRASIVTYIKLIRFFFNFLVEKGELEVNIAKDVQVLPAPEKEQKQLAHYYTYEEIMRRYLGCKEQRVSYCYLNQVKKHLNGFIKFLIANGVGSVYVVTEATLLQYRNFLWEELVQMKDTALVVRSQIERLRRVVFLFNYLGKEGILKDNPVQGLNWDSYYKEIIEKAKTLPDKPKRNNDLTELEELGVKFCEYETGKGKSPKTVKMYKKGLKVFFHYMEEQGILNLAQFTKRHALDYFNYICSYVGDRGNPISNNYKNYLIWSMKLFFRFLVRYEYLRIDPSEDIESIKEQRGLPHACMNDREVEKLLEQPTLSRDPLNIRDKAMLEVLYSTGIRCAELCGLNIEDIDYQQGFIRINHPKGGVNYQRVVPIGDKAIESVQFYLKESRTALQNGDPKALFISHNGHRLQNETVLNVVKKYAFQCGFRKRITTHSFRSTCATLMFKGGADTRYVQEQLGHKKISSTECYIRLVPTDLKAIHKKCHPREKRFRQMVN